MGKWVSFDMMRDSDSFAGLCDQNNIYSLPEFQARKFAEGGEAKHEGEDLEGVEAKRQRTE